MDDDEINIEGTIIIDKKKSRNSSIDYLPAQAKLDSW
jgi:hypothetical protein